jgi:glycosyltransferase 2 family protein
MVEAKQEQEFKSAFKGWKIALALILGLGFTTYMLISALNKKEYLKVADQQGTHVWVDGNSNKKIDTHQSVDFKISAKGNYKEKQLKDVLREITWTSTSVLWIFFAFVCMFGRDFGYMLRIRTLTKKELSWKSSFYTIMLWEFASALSPGVVGGATVAMFILNKEKIALGRSTAIVVITALMDNLFYVLLIPIVFLFLQGHGLFPTNGNVSVSIEYAFWIGYSVMFAICIILYLSIFKYPKLLSSLLKGIFSLPLLRRVKDKAMKTAEEIEITSKELQTEPKSFWLKAFGATVLSWTSRFLVINCVMQAFIALGWFTHLLILGKQLVLWLFLIISPTPGASGIAEYAFGELLSDLGVSALLIASLAIIWRLISYFPYLLIGAIILPRWLSKK